MRQKFFLCNPVSRLFCRIRAYLLLAAFVAASLASGAGAKSLPCWPMQGNNPQHTCQSASTGPATKPVVKWVLPGTQWGPAYIAYDGTVYRYEAQANRLLHYDRDGSLLWSHPDTCYKFALDEQGHVYLHEGGCFGKKASLNSMGFKEWEGSENYWNGGFGISVSGGLIHFQEQIYDREGTPAGPGYCTFYPDTIPDNADSTLVYRQRCSRGRDPHVIDAQQIERSPDTGREFWKTLWSYPGAELRCVTPDGLILAVSNGALLAIKPDGTLQWNKEGHHTSQPTSIAVTDSGIIYALKEAPGDYDCVASYDLEGNTRWEITVPGYIQTALAADAADNIYFATVNPYALYCYSAGGGKRWKLDSLCVPTSSFEHITIGDDGCLYVYSMCGGAGSLYCLISRAPLTELSSFTASAGNSHAVLCWKTRTEPGNAGFNLYRAEAANGAYRRVNTALIPAQGSTADGASYEYVDDTVKNGTACFYRLENIDLQDNNFFRGPIEAVVQKRGVAAR
jgi:outer membrane protein assembly factor BamB